MNSGSLFGRGVLGLGAGFFVIFGVWAFLAPLSFFANIARWEPYNEHFLHDAGAFQIGIGLALLASFTPAKGSVVALAGAASASAIHALSHIVDAGEGGRASDPYLLTGLAGLLLLGLWFEWRTQT